MTILERILGNKIQEVARRKQKVPLGTLEKHGLFDREVLQMTAYVVDKRKTGIIAEFKRKSPSRGVINENVTVEEVTTGYFRSGASALSILTDHLFFGGSDRDLKRARELNPIPILRKDFIIDEYQVIESKAMGADAILLIAAVLDRKKTGMLARLAHSVGLQVLLELHEERELDAIGEHIDLIGVNNRDLKTFTVDLERSFSMADKLPGRMVRVSESGISSPLVIRRLRKAGYQGFLMGESFMRTPDPASAFASFVKLILRDDD